MPRRRRSTGEPPGGGTADGGGPAPRTHRSRTHAPYPAEFRAEAVRLARSGVASAARVAGDLGVSPDTLRAWVRQTRIDAGEQEGLTTEERAELSQLRREVRVLREEREILKKAAAFFAKESAGLMGGSR
jgi:transposase